MNAKQFLFRWCNTVHGRDAPADYRLANWPITY